MTPNLEVLTTLSLILLAAFAVYNARPLLKRIDERIEAQTNLLDQQASHVSINIEAERLNTEKLIKSYEQQGANKLRTELSRLGEDYAAQLKLLQIKLPGAISKTDHEADLAKARKIIADLEAQLAVREAISAVTTVEGSTVPTIFNGQPSPGAAVPV